jgi:hypothetical protein
MVEAHDCDITGHSMVEAQDCDITGHSIVEAQDCDGACPAAWELPTDGSEFLFLRPSGDSACPARMGAAHRRYLPSSCFYSYSPQEGEVGMSSPCARPGMRTAGLGPDPLSILQLDLGVNLSFLLY